MLSLLRALHVAANPMQNYSILTLPYYSATRRFRSETKLFVTLPMQSVSMQFHSSTICRRHGALRSLTIAQPIFTVQNPYSALPGGALPWPNKTLLHIAMTKHILTVQIPSRTSPDFANTNQYLTSLFHYLSMRSVLRFYYDTHYSANNAATVQNSTIALSFLTIPFRFLSRLCVAHAKPILAQQSLNISFHCETTP